MKKIFALILVLALVLPAAALSSVEAWLIEGAWTHVEDTESGKLITSMYLEEDGKAYFVTQMFYSEEPGLGRSFVGSWEFTGPDTIHVITGNNSSIDLTYHSFNMMFDHELHDYYFRAEMRDGDVLQ